jgi:serine/threonine-protein kinase
MDLYCTRPGCPKPVNLFSDLDDPATLKSVQQKYCSTCGMPLILVGHYLPLKLLGQGGFGAAFLARDRYMPGMRQCVVKQFQPSNHLSPTQLKVAQQMFEREAQALEELGNTHPQIPDLFAFFELSVPSWQPDKQDKFFYLVQEFIDGQTMEQELAQNGPMSAQDVLFVMQEILKVLQFVHDHGAIHRDIKPSNIMRHCNGRIYLLDFGAVGQATKGGAKSTGIFSEGFAPPEQMRGGEIYPSSDLYALAVTCLLLLTGKIPAQLYNARYDTWEWRQEVPQIPPPLADVLDRMLKGTPDERFQSAIEVLETLNIHPSLRISHPSASFPYPSTSSGLPFYTQPPFPTSPSLPETSLPSQSSSPTTSASLSPLSSSPGPVPSSPIPVVPAPSVFSQPPPSTPNSSPSSAVPSPPPPHASSARGGFLLQSAIAPFSTLELIANAGFTGFQSSLVGIGLASLFGTSFISAGFWVVLLIGLIFVQSRRIIERIDLLIIAGITLTLVMVVAPLRRAIATPIAGNLLFTVVVVAVLAGLAAIALTTLFRLIYKLLSRFLR